MSEKLNGLYSAVDARHADLICKFGMTHEEIREIAEPYLAPIPGEMKMTSFRRDIGMELRNGVYVAKEGADGWVYPDGSWFMCSQFPEISAEYATSTTAKVFQVPVITEFMKSAPNSSTYKQMQPAVNVISAHSHGISESGSINTEISLPKGYHIRASEMCNSQEYVTERFSDGKGGTITISVPKAHNGKLKQVGQSGKYRKRWMNMEVTFSEFSMLFQNTESDLTGTVNAQFEPASYNQPIMLYLGKPKLDAAVPEVGLYNVSYYDGKYYTYNQSTKSYNTSPSTTKSNLIQTVRTASDGSSNITVTAPAYTEYDYEKWDPAISGIRSDTNTYAVYKQKLFNVCFSYTKNTGYGTDQTVSENITVGYGQSVLASDLRRMQAFHPFGFTFSRWSDTQYNNVNANRVIIANYAPNSIDVAVQSVNESGSPIPDAATFTGPGTYLYGTSVIVRAVPKLGYRFVKWIYGGSEITDRDLTINVEGIESGTLTAKAVFKAYTIQSIKFYYPYTVSEIGNSVVSKPTNSSKAVSMTSTAVKNAISSAGCTAANTYYVKVEWGDGNVSYYEYNKSIQHTYVAAGTYDIKITGMRKSLMTGYNETVSGTDYRIFVDLNGAKPAKKTTSSYMLFDGGTTTKDDSTFDGFLPSVTSNYKCVICDITCADGSHLTENGILRNETSNVATQYYYVLAEKVTRKGLSYDSDAVNYLPCDNYTIYADSSCTMQSDSFDLTTKGERKATLVTGSPVTYVYGVNPSWIPFSSSIDCEGANGLIFRNVW